MISRAFELFTRRIDGPLMAVLALTVALGATQASAATTIAVRPRPVSALCGDRCQDAATASNASPAAPHDTQYWPTL